jgi:hypothetical protein
LDKPDAIKVNPIAKTIKRPNARLLNKRSQQRHLDDEQVNRIENLCLLGKTNRVDNEWRKLTLLFQAYSGFSFVDVGDNFELLKGEIDIIEIDRKKTSMPSIIPVIPELRNVLDGLDGLEQTNIDQKGFFQFGNLCWVIKPMTKNSMILIINFIEML